MARFERMGIYCLLILAASTPGHSQPARLFQHDAVLRIELTADFSAMLRVQDQDKAVFGPGILRLLGHNGVDKSIPVEVKPRGQSRLSDDRCRFPLLFLRFDTTTVENTPFEDQTILPVTSHCRSQERYLQYLHKEHLVYKTYNLLTEYSLQTRLVNIRYVDSANKIKPLQRFAFFVEHFDAFAYRENARIRDPGKVSLSQISEPDLALMEVFQYLVANTDWSAAFGHNVVLLDIGGKIVPVPFDFDSSGVVNAPYAQVSEKLKIRSVTQRLFRGYCKPGTVIADAVEKVLVKKEAILRLGQQYEHLESRTRKKLLKFYDAFFKIAETPKSREKSILRACRKRGG